MELQQSVLYAQYIESLHWKIFTIDGVQMFYRNIPLTGGILKIQRPKRLPTVKKLVPIIRQYHVTRVAVEPDEKQNSALYKRWCGDLGKYVKVIRSSYMPTKTIRVDLTVTEDEIFRRFTEAKRRAVRKAEKNGVTAIESSDIRELIKIKNKSGGFLGFITTAGIDKLWPLMYPAHASIVLAHANDGILVGGIFLLFWNTTAHYWIAGASSEGKKLFAPTLLVWEALKISKKHGCKDFDFVGVWDQRKPKDHHDWLGFTKFKEGFGGRPFYYPIF